MAIFCLLFIVIGGVSASDVTDMSINPDNNNLVSDSIDQISEESNGNYYTNQLSNDGVSSSDSENLESSDLISEDNSKIKSGALSSSSLSASTDSSTKNTATKKNATTLSISNTDFSAESAAHTCFGLIVNRAYEGDDGLYLNLKNAGYTLSSVTLVLMVMMIITLLN